MEPMTLDEAKLIADCNRRLPGRASTGAPEATVVLAAALRTLLDAARGTR